MEKKENTNNLFFIRRSMLDKIRENVNIYYVLIWLLSKVDTNVDGHVNALESLTNTQRKFKVRGECAQKCKQSHLSRGSCICVFGVFSWSDKNKNTKISKRSFWLFSATVQVDCNIYCFLIEFLNCINLNEWFNWATKTMKIMHENRF